MKKVAAGIFFDAVVLAALLCGFISSGKAAAPLHIDVLYMNHGPLQPTLERMRDTFAFYGDKVQVNWYDFESQEGAAFMAQKGISNHVPLEIWLDGKDTLTLDGRQVRFSGFPTGAGPGFFQGQWTLEDLGKVIDALTTGR